MIAFPHKKPGLAILLLYSAFVVAWLAGHLWLMSVLDVQAQEAERLDVVGHMVFAGITVAFLGWLLYVGASRRRQVETALGKSEELFQTLARLSPVGIFRSDAQGSCIYVNEAWVRIAGLSAEQALGDGWTATVHPEDRPAVLAAWSRCVAGHTSTRVEYRFVRPDGSIAWVLGEVHPEPRSAQSGFVGTITDITESREARLQVEALNADLENRVKQRTAELETANDELRSFSFSVSHDLRAPLRKITASGTLLARDHGAQLNAAGQREIDSILAAARRMAELIEDLLSLSRVTRAELRLEPIDLSAMAGQIVAELRRVEPGRSVAVNLAPDLKVNADTQLMRVMLENLLSNAWKFTSRQPDARIELGAVSGSGEPRTFFVRDNGAGFDMEYAGKLFGPFQRLHNQSEFPGTGIGLATVQRIVQRHGGRIWAEGKEGAGATFYFAL